MQDATRCGQAGVLGAISRVADHSLLDRRRGGLRQAGDRRRLGDVRRLDRVRAADLRGEQPDGAAADQVGQRVDQPVDQVAVLVAPPEHHRVDHVAVVAVDHVGVDGVLDGDPQPVVGVGVPAELLDDHAGLEPEPLGGPGSARLGGAPTLGRAHAVLLRLCCHLCRTPAAAGVLMGDSPAELRGRRKRAAADAGPQVPTPLGEAPAAYSSVARSTFVAARPTVTR